MKHKKVSPAAKQDISEIIAPISTSETSCIRNFILMVLKKLPSCNTLEFRKLGVFTVAPRIFELRHRFNHEIDTIFEDIYDDLGVFHKRVARYVLKSS